MNDVSAHFHQVEMKPKDFRSEIDPVWCAGCGHYGILSGIYRAMSELGLDPNYTVNISGIGCSSRTPYFVKSYQMHTLHGRAGAVATGTQLARPDLAVIVTGGDGDGFSIGGGHMPHLARKNVNMSYVMMDNRIYGLTKGQVSPTSRKEMKAYTTPYGGVEEPLDPVLYMLTYGATYVGQAFAGNPKMCARLIKGALEHRGFAFVNIFSQCPTFNTIDTANYFKDLVVDVEEEIDLGDVMSAMNRVQQMNHEGKLAVGLLHQSHRATLDEEMSRLIAQVGGNADYDLQTIIDDSRP
ncbi:MAG: 2-oxoacid:ferredoxin oxidoreductase subunit beta [Gammaproteobacteria bacterium]|nr:2-oxoacid:ferredoxin oxidoreductase subunit beta [Gammaproteobacteria bacterium]